MHSKKTFSLLSLVALLLTGFSAFSQVAPLPAEVSAVKHEDAAKFEYLVSNLGTATEASDLEALFKARPGIVDALADANSHLIIVYARRDMPESDIHEVLKFAGKTIITNPDLVTKYYH